jgi:hypothetical protein
MQTSYPRAKIPYLSLLIILALINQPYLESLPVTRASEVIVTSKPMGNGQWAMGNGQRISPSKKSLATKNQKT